MAVGQPPEAANVLSGRGIFVVAWRVPFGGTDWESTAHARAVSGLTVPRVRATAGSAPTAAGHFLAQTFKDREKKHALAPRSLPYKVTVAGRRHPGANTMSTSGWCARPSLEGVAPRSWRSCPG